MLLPKEVIWMTLNASQMMNSLVVQMDVIMQFLNYSWVICWLKMFLAAVAYYWVFHVPLNWKKGLDDVSFDLALGHDRKIKPKHKREAINRMRRLRKIGASELPPPFPNGWYNIAESSDVRKGDAISVACLGEQFVVYRTASNEVHVLDAYCPHLGANLGIGGKVVGDNIECPFHKWVFRGSDGKCVNVPYSSCSPPASSKVRKWISKEMHDFIFIWYHAEDEEPWELPLIEGIDNHGYVYHGRNEFNVNCHIQEIPENGADLAHFRAIHDKSFLAGSNPGKSIFTKFGTHIWNAMWEGSNPNAKHISRLVLTHSMEFFSKYQFCDVDVTALQVGPGYVQLHMKSILGPFVVLQTVTPLEPLVQKVIHRFYAPRIIAPFMKIAIVVESVMVERDINMWNHKVYRSKPHLVKEDHLIKSFRAWYNQFYSNNSKTFAHAQENLDW